MGNVCDAFCPIAKRHMAQQPAVNVSIRPFYRLNAAGRPVLGSEVCFRISPTSPLQDLFDFYASTRDIPLALLCCRSLSDGELVRGDQTPADLGLEAGGQLDLAAALKESSPPGGLPKYLLQQILEFLPLDEVHGAKRVCAKQVSFCWRETGRSAIMRGRWKSVNWVAVHGKRSMCFGVHAPVFDREARDLPLALRLCRKAWEVEPTETLRIVLTWGTDRHAARFLAIVEPSLDGLERIVRLLEPAHRFVYAKNQMSRWAYGDTRADGRNRIDSDTAIVVIRLWAAYIGAPFDAPNLNSLPMVRRNLVVSYVSGALRSWTDAAVAADFFCCFFRDDHVNLTMVPDLGDFTRGWEGERASALAAAYAADVAASQLSFLPWPLFTEALDRVEQFLQLKQRYPKVRIPVGDWVRGDDTVYFWCVEGACRSPGKFYDLY